MRNARKALREFLHRAVGPHSIDEDRGRREFIFNVLALSALALILVAIIDNTVHILSSDQTVHRADSLSSLALYTLSIFFAFLYALSIRGKAAFASYLFLAALFDLAAYMGYRWGVDLSASLLFYALVITMAGILISAHFAFVVAFLAGAAISITVHFRHIGMIQPDRSWVIELWKSDDVLVTTIVFFVIATVMWLSNREIEKSLGRARRSEADLRHERDQLEVRVEERTRELRQAELERMTQAYRFVEFGRLASGIFHDLMNPLAGLTLNIDRIADAPEPRAMLSEDVQRAKRAATHMQDLLLSMRRHLANERSIELFSLRRTVEESLQLVATYAQKENVRCTFAARGDAQLYGDPIALSQVLTNLVNNAIQARSPTVSISLVIASDRAQLEVSDTGPGIPDDVLPRIFEPYFTTKGPEYGVGLGLSLVKRIIEKDFGGSISAESGPRGGSVFTLSFPLFRTEENKG